jgi:hypothetical protein
MRKQVNKHVWTNMQHHIRKTIWKQQVRTIVRTQVWNNKCGNKSENKSEKQVCNKFINTTHLNTYKNKSEHKSENTSSTTQSENKSETKTCETKVTQHVTTKEVPTQVWKTQSAATVGSTLFSLVFWLSRICSYPFFRFMFALCFFWLVHEHLYAYDSYTCVLVYALCLCVHQAVRW